MSLMMLSRGRMKLHHERDPKEVLMERIGDLSGVNLSLNRVLCAIYEMPKDAKTKGGIILADKTTGNSVWESKSLLVLKMGPLAFKDDEHVNFGGMKVNEGDWVFARAQDGSILEINGVAMRLYRDVDILGTLDDPDAIW